MGTVNVLEAVRHCPSIRAVVIVTTDKCYENHSWHWGYREVDRLGGHDPYSASKAATELAVDSYRNSFFNDGGPLLATARAGNVIGGGDWSENRLIPDAVRAVEARRDLIIRNPSATRPWQHVLDCLSGYLRLSEHLLSGNAASATAYNFGPEASSNLSVENLLTRLRHVWPDVSWQFDLQATEMPHEAAVLYLDSSKARNELGWRPRWGLDEALTATADWYRTVMANPAAAAALVEGQIKSYTEISSS